MNNFDRAEKACYERLKKQNKKTDREIELEKKLEIAVRSLKEIKNAYIDLTTQDEYGSYYIDEAKLFVEVVGKTIKDYDELELKQGEVLK